MPNYKKMYYELLNATEEAINKLIAAQRKATKIIIPSELQGIAGLAAAAKTVFDTEDPRATITKTVPKQ